MFLLADVFEQFRVSCYKTYNLDPAHYFPLPGFTCDAKLKHSWWALSDMLRKASACNNKYMLSYIPSKLDVFITTL